MTVWIVSSLPILLSLAYFAADIDDADAMSAIMAVPA
jgi:hypothetical protein